MKKDKILIIGTGAFGSAISQPLIYNEHEVYFYSRSRQVAESLLEGKSEVFKDLTLLKPMKIYDSFDTAFKEHKFDYIVLAVPSVGLADVYDRLKRYLNPSITIINTTKGFTANNDGLWSEFFKKDGLIKNYALIAGPSFANELIRNDKTIVNIVSDSKELNEQIKKMFDTPFLKLIPYENELIASLVSCFKNALALASGMIYEATSSYNTRAAYLTMGINEMRMLVDAIGPHHSKDMFNYCGIGDVFLTCTARNSRNFSFGAQVYNLGIQKAIEESGNKTVEGLRTLKFIYEYKQKYNLDLILFDCLYKVCFEDLDPKQFIHEVWKKYN